MATSSTSWHTLSDGLKIYERVWNPSSPAKAHIVLLHGFSDRIDHYDAFLKVLTNQYPIRVIGWDRRGWGKSVHESYQRGNTGTKDQQMTELNSYINHTLTTIPDLTSTPLFLLGHSMGGQELTYYMLHTDPIPYDARPRIGGILLEAPFIGLDPASQPSSIVVALGRFASKLLPHFQLKQGVSAEFLSPDKAVQAMYRDDPLCHDTGTLECFRDMLQREADLTALAKGDVEGLSRQLPCPVLWAHGTADKATAFPISRKLCEALKACGAAEGNKVFKAYEGWYHQLHNEPNGGREQYAKDVAEWVLAVAGRRSSKL
ncbi:hypothetical protein R6Q59_009849 [Mikania micrantha]